MTAAEIRKRSRSNFGLAFLGLPRDQRHALNALYAFCRTVDDIVDEARDKDAARHELNRWRNTLDRIHRPSVYDSPLAHEVSEAVRLFPIQVDDLRWILDGVESDLTRTRYQTFEELLSYCDSVASVVGLCSMAIFGADRHRTAKYAFATGRALQLTNILRDVATDAKRGRIYLPQNDLEKFGYRERDLLRATYSPSFVELMAFEARRIQEFFLQAKFALSPEEQRQFPAAELMRRMYEALLARIVARNFQVFPKKLNVPASKKLAIAMSVWVPKLFKAA